MATLLQHGSGLAIRASLFLAQQTPGKLTPVREIAADVGVSEAYLAKILQRLATAGLIRSFRGPGRGMELGRASDAITLSAVIHAVEGQKPPEACVLGLGKCSEEHPCVLHSEWVPLNRGIRELLEERTLADLVRAVAKQRDSEAANGPAGRRARAARRVHRKKEGSR